MHICDLCGTTVAQINENQVCKSCASMTFKAVKQEVKKAVEDRDNQDFMLAYFDISLAQFEAVTHDNLSEIVDSEFARFYKNDAKRVLWHEYRENAFTKKGDLRKAVEKKILETIEAKKVEVVAELVIKVKKTTQPKGTETMATLIKNYSTVGLNARHEGLKGVNMTRVEFDVYGDDDVRVYAVSGHNFERLPIPSITITRQQLADLPDDPYNDTVFACAAFRLLGLQYE